MSVMTGTFDPKVLKGHKVLLTLSENNQTFEGLFHTFNERRSSIILRQVISVPSDGRDFEQLQFHLKDIQDIRKLSGDQANGNSDEIAITDQSSEVSSRSKPCSSFFNELYYDNLKLKVSEHIHLKEINKDFHDALKSIQHISTLAVTGEGSDEGRFGLMGLLCISTARSVFLFDITNLGDQVFKAGNAALKRILESKDVLKVVHNCRLLSDNLLHKYNVKLTNVFDTQVMYSVVIRNKCGSFPSDAVTISTLLSLLFDLPEGFCKEDVSLNQWRRRPIPSELLNAAAWRVSFLLPLKLALENALYNPFERLCNFYLKNVRDSDLFEARASVDRNTLLPRGMTEVFEDNSGF